MAARLGEPSAARSSFRAAAAAYRDWARANPRRYALAFAQRPDPPLATAVETLLAADARTTPTQHGCEVGLLVLR